MLWILHFMSRPPPVQWDFPTSLPFHPTHKCVLLWGTLWSCGEINEGVKAAAGGGTGVQTSVQLGKLLGLRTAEPLRSAVRPH